MSGLTGNNILAGSSGQATGYNINQSLRFEDGDSAYLEKTFSGAGTGAGTRWTFSCFVKRGNIGTEQVLIGAGVSSSGRAIVYFDSSDKLVLQIIDSGITRSHLVTSQVFRDVASWYHIVAVQAEPDATSTDRVRLYVNGSRLTDFTTETYSAVNAGSYITNAWTHRIGSLPYSVSSLFDGYLAEIYLIDGQSLDSSNFGETNADTNQWIAKKYAGSYGTNGFYLKFQDSSALGDDSSGNTNDFTPTNLAATDQVLDSPTNNFATLNPLAKYSTKTLSEGNLKCSSSTSDNGLVLSTIGESSGKWYWESTYTGSNSSWIGGIAKTSISGLTYSNLTSGDSYSINPTGKTYNGQTEYSDVNTYAVGDVCGIALNLDSGTVSFYKNNSLEKTFSSVSGTFVPMILNNDSVISINFGQDSSFAGNKTAQGNTDGNGKGDFYYTPPSGYLALCEDNLPDPSIVLPGDHFEAVVYVGDGNSTQEVTTDFQPDFTWNKNRTTSYHHRFFDRVRGLDKSVYSNKTAAEDTYQDYGYPTATSSTSVTVGRGTDANNLINANNQNYVMWNWKADNTSGSSNTDGTITSTVSANPTAGFSIVSYTVPSGGGFSVGHGLSTAPKLILAKNRDTTSNWDVYSESIGNTKRLLLNTTDAPQTVPAWNNTTPTASVFYSVGGGTWHAVGGKMINYVFSEVEGYSKIGSYTGNGAQDGSFVYTGFRPAFIFIKRITSSGSNSYIVDNKRIGYNHFVYATDAGSNKYLWPDSNATEGNGNTTRGIGMDILSNGFKFRTNGSDYNASGNDYLFYAIAESPFKYSNAR